MSEPNVSNPTETPTEPIPVLQAEVEETLIEVDHAPELKGADDPDRADDRLFSLVAIGLMVLLLICVALVLIADRRPPAGL